MKSSGIHSQGFPKAPYLYGKSPVMERGGGRMSLPMWGMPGMPMPAPPPSNPHTAAVLNSCYEAAMAGQDLPPLRRKKLSSLLMNRGGDTPILRTVLGQGQADSSQPMPLVCQPDSHERNHTNGSPRDTDKVHNILHHATNFCCLKISYTNQSIIHGLICFRLHSIVG